MQNPSIGRIVHVQQYESGVKLGEPQAAIITKVWTGHHVANLVNLHVFLDGRDSIPLTSIPDDAHPTTGTGWAWSWPPRA